MPTQLRLRTARPGHGSGLRLEASGEIDLSNVDELKSALADAVAEIGGSGAELVVDLAEVEYVDSAAINVLSAYADAIHRIVVHPYLLSTLRVSGVTELVTVDAVQR